MNNLEKLKSDPVWKETKYNIYGCSINIDWNNVKEEDIISFDQKDQILVIKYKNATRYLKKGRLHCLDGPAVIFDNSPNDDVDCYFINGELKSKEEIQRYKKKHTHQYIEITAKYLNELLISKTITKQELLEYDSEIVEYWKENYDPEFLEIGSKWEHPKNGTEITVSKFPGPLFSPPSVYFTDNKNVTISFPIKDAKKFKLYQPKQKSVLEQLKQDPVWKDAIISFNDKWNIQDLEESNFISWDPEKEELVIYYNSAKRYLKKGLLHRDGNPAIEFSDGLTQWAQNGKRHRDDGPAHHFPAHEHEYKSWFLNNIMYSEQEYHAQPNKDLNYLKQKIQEQWKGTELEANFPNITEYLIKDDIVWFRADLNNLPYHHCFKNNFRYGKPIDNQQQYGLQDFEDELKRDIEQKINTSAEKSEIIEFLKNDPIWSKIGFPLTVSWDLVKKEDIISWDPENDRLTLKYESNIYHFRNGILHREDGPAVESSSGTKIWYQNGYKHRDGGPAYIIDNNREWYQFGKLHRDDGPAKERIGGAWDGEKSWYINGELHREDGPASIHRNGNVYYYLNDVLFNSKEHFEKELAFRNKSIPKIENKSETNQAFNIIAANQCKKAFHTALPTQYLPLLDSKLGSEMLHYVLGHVGQSKLPQFENIFREIKIESLTSLQELLVKSIAENISSLPEKEDQITQTIHQSYTDHA